MKLRGLQQRLAMAGLSSLGRGEPHVLANINRVINLLSAALLQQPFEPVGHDSHAAIETGHRLLRQRAERSEYIMVTMPTEAAGDPALVDRLIVAGMNVAHINCAHDSADTWRGMIGNIRSTARLRRRECRIFMDLGGHKIRTRYVVTRRESDGNTRTRASRLFRDDWLVLCTECATPEFHENLFDAPVKVAVTCTCPEIIDRLVPGETVWIDDGKIGTVIRQQRCNAVLLQVNRVCPKGARIKAEKRPELSRDTTEPAGPEPQGPGRPGIRQPARRHGGPVLHRAGG